MKRDSGHEKLAVNGGPKAFPGSGDKRKPKIGIDEFMAIARRFGFSPEKLNEIRAAVSDEDPGRGPTLARYMSTWPTPSSGECFEETAREIFGVKHAMGLSSGTGALHSAYVAAGVGPGTEVIVPAIGFYATAAAVVMSGGIPVFCDVDKSLHMDARRMEDLITPRTVAVVPTCVYGGVYDMDPILDVARRHGLTVIEDCSQSPGGKYRGSYVGTLGDMGCFSISAYKTTGGGEGGLLLTNDSRLFERASQLAESGGLWRPDRFAPPRWEGELFCGTNYRMSELEAAMDTVQLKKMPDTVRRYNTVKRSILGQLKSYREIEPQKINDIEGEVGSTLRFYPETIGLGRSIAGALNAEGIGCGDFVFHAECAVRDENAAPDWHVYYDMFPVVLKTGATDAGCPFSCPIYREKGGSITYARGDCPVADDLFNRQITIWLDPWYSPEDCTAIAGGINKVLSAFCTEDGHAVKWM